LLALYQMEKRARLHLITACTANNKSTQADRCTVRGCDLDIP
jgi:hypothetical protein